MGKFGGHAMAVGLTLPRTSLDSFTIAFNAVVASMLTEGVLNNTILSDGELKANELTLEIAEVLRNAGPWGQAFPEPLFDGVFEILEQRLVGGKHLKLTVGQAGCVLDAIAFNIDINTWPNYRCNYVNIAYRMDVNEFRQKRNVQLIIEQLEPLS
jgi:single-stranded-DNA-specific exonuclease